MTEDRAGASQTLRARLPVAAPFLAVLAGLIGQLTHGRGVIWTGDSFGFVYAGLRLASGQSPVGQLGGRNVGYPLLTAVLTPLGGLRALVTFQSIVAAASLVALLLVLRTFLRNRWAFCFGGLLAVLCAYSSDNFVVYAQTLNADSLFGSFLVMSLLLFVTAWRRAGATRAGCLVGALALSYAAYLVKPNGVLVILLCVAGVAASAVRNPRAFLNRWVIAGLVALAATVAVTLACQAKWKDPNTYFGPGVLYTAHMNLIDFDLDRATPEHRALHDQLDKVLADPRKWSALGFDADLCYYDDGCQNAIRAAAKADGMDPGAWMMRHFLGSVARHPKTYAAKVVRESAFFLAHPNLEADLVYPSAIVDADWNRIAPYAQLIRFPRIELNRPIGSWFAERHRLLAGIGKRLIHLMLWTLPLVAVLSTLAAAVLVVRRRRVEGPLERAFVCVTAFVIACVLSVAMPFTFDVPRYAASFSLLTYLWWMLGVLYLAKLATALGLVEARVGHKRMDVAVSWDMPGASIPESVRRHAARTVYGMKVAAAVTGLVWSRTREFWDRLLIALPWAALALLLTGQITQGRQLIYNPDSAGFLHPGLLLASGQDPTGQSVRNLGYPLFLAATLPLGGFKALLVAEALAAIASVGALLLAVRRLVRPPLAFAAVGVAMVVTIAAIDNFELNIQMLTGEGLFEALMPLPLVFLLTGWAARGGRRIGLLIAALASAYLTYLVKPNALLELPVCVAALALAACLDWRAFMRPKVLAALGALVAAVAVAQFYQDRLLPKDFDFAERHMYCMHLDVVQPEVGSATPERRRLAEALNDVRRLPNAGYSLIGYDVNACLWRAPPQEALHAVAEAEGMTAKAWMRRQFLLGFSHRPLVYVGEVTRQVISYFRAPAGDAASTVIEASQVSDGWNDLAAHYNVVRTPRAELDNPAVKSWFAAQHSRLSGFGKAIIGLFVGSAAWIGIPAALLALIRLVRRLRRGEDVSSELQVLSGAAIMGAAILTVAMTNTWANNGRFGSTLAPTALLWWFVSGLYLVKLAIERDRLRASRRGGSHAGGNARGLTLSAAGNLALAICALVTVGWMVLQMGAAHIDQTFTGPFSGEETNGSQLKAIDPRPLGALSCCLTAPSDGVGHGNASRLRLWVNGEEILPPHTAHDEIRQGHPGFSHWGKEVYFALPPGALNAGQTRVRLSEPLRPAAWTALFPALTLALFIGFYRQRARVWIANRSASASLVMKGPYLVLFAFGWTVLLAGVAYLATVLWGVATGEALAPAIPFRSDLGKALVEALDPAVLFCLLVLAAVGVGLGWAAARSPYRAVLRRAEVSGIRWMKRYGLFCLVMFYLACVGVAWAGIWRGGSTLAFLGLVPYFDAHGYFIDVHQFLRDGSWSELSSRRPLAASLRAASFGISDFRFGVVLIWQAVAMAGSTFFATMTIARWRGLWAAIVFVVLAFIAVRAHLPTLMTEPLALPIAFVAFGFLAEAFRTSSRGHALMALALLSAALWVRPGAMFVIPGLTLWYAWSFHETPLQKLKGFAIACLPTLAVIALDKLLGLFFATHSSGDLADSICGLTLGGGWQACLTAYPQEYAKVSASPEAQAAWFYAKALYNIQHDPGTLVRTLLQEATSFWTDAPRVLFQGYSRLAVPDAFPSVLWFLTIAVFDGLGLHKRNLRVEAPFWLLVAAGLTVSAMVVYLSDGVRAMAVTYPLLGLFVAAAFSSPVAPQIQCGRTARRELRLGAVLTVAVTAGLFLFLHVERLIYPLQHTGLPPGQGGAMVGDFARSTGLLVVADDQPLPHGVPSVHLSRFAEVVHATGAEVHQGIISPQMPKLPFGFMEMPTLDHGGALTLLTPPEMVTRKDVRAWHVEYEGWDQIGGLFSDNWVHVIRATPYFKPADK